VKAFIGLSSFFAKTVAGDALDLSDAIEETVAAVLEL
jgi:hypothetical protein